MPERGFRSGTKYVELARTVDGLSALYFRLKTGRAGVTSSRRVGRTEHAYPVAAEWHFGSRYPRMPKPESILDLQQLFAETDLRHAARGYPDGLKTFECLARVQAGGLSYPWNAKILC